MKQDFEQRIWLPVVFFIIGFLVAELPLISTINNRRNRTNYAELLSEYLQEYFFTPSQAFVVLTVIVALVSALSGFAYLHSAKKLDVYHSLPIRREKLFLQQYVYGILYYVVPLLIHVLICMAICIGNGLMDAALLGSAIGFLFVQILFYLVSYSMVVVAVCLTGNMVISVLGSGILLFYSLLSEMIKNGMMSYFFKTYYGADTEFPIPAFTPVHLIYQLIADVSRANAPRVAYMAYWDHYGKILFATVVYTLFALYLYKKRPSETAGNTLVFPVTEPVVKTMIVIPVSLLSGSFFAAVFGSGAGLKWYTVGAIFGFVIACPLMEIIFRKDVKAVFSHPLQIVFNGTCVVVLLAILYFDLLGYDSYVPKESKVESYAIDFSDIPTVRVTDGSISYDYRLENMEITDNASARKLLEHAAEFTRPVRQGEYTAELAEGTIRTAQVDVKYNLKNGKEIYRDYQINLQDEQVLQWLKDTYNDMQHKLAVYPILTDGSGEGYIGVMVESTFADRQVLLPEEKMKKLIETYRKELTNLKAEDVIEEYPVAELSFMLTTSEQTGEEIVVHETAVYYPGDYKYDYYQEYGYLIYPSFIQTIALLEEYQVGVASTIPAESVLEIAVTDYSREVNDSDGMYDKIAELSYTPETASVEEIEALLSGIIGSRFDRGFNTGNSREPYIDVMVRYMDSDIEHSVYCNFKENQVPEFVLEHVAKMY